MGLLSSQLTLPCFALLARACPPLWLQPCLPAAHSTLPLLRFFSLSLLVASLDALRDRRQRTVYRLTLVKSKSAGIADGSAPADAPDDGNMGQLEEYAALVARGQPDFIEIKGVTWVSADSEGGRGRQREA